MHIPPLRSRRRQRPAFAALLIATLVAASAGPAGAESLASSASSASSTSVGSLSDSLTGSSDASSPGRRVADGDYRIVEVAEAAPDRWRLTLEPVAGGETLHLRLPVRLGQDQPLAVGDVLATRQRPYGLEIARGDTRQALYLLLTDDWQRALAPRPVDL